MTERQTEALERLNQGIQESRQEVQQRTMSLAQDYFGDSAEALKQQIKDNRATLEGLPDQIPGGREEAFQTMFQELMDNYSSMEQCIDEARDNVANLDTDKIRRQGEIEATDAARREAKERGVDLTQVEGTGSDGRIIVSDVVEAAEEMEDSESGAAEEAADGAQQQAGQVAGQAQEAAGGAADQARDAAGGVAGQAQDVAGQAAGQAQEAAGQATDQAGQVAGQAQGAAGQATGQAQDTAGQAAGQVQDAVGGLTGDGQGDGGPLGGAADQVGQLAGQAQGVAGQAQGAAGDAAGQAQETVGYAPEQALDAAGQAAGGEDEGPKATNAARRKAQEMGVDLSTIQGSGSGGLITIRDVVGS